MIPPGGIICQDALRYHLCIVGGIGALPTAIVENVKTLRHPRRSGRNEYKRKNPDEEPAEYRVGNHGQNRVEVDRKTSQVKEHEEIGKRAFPAYRAIPASVFSGYGYSLPSPVMGIWSPKYFGRCLSSTSKTAFSLANNSRT